MTLNEHGSQQSIGSFLLATSSLDFKDETLKSRTMAANAGIKTRAEFTDSKPTIEIDATENKGTENGTMLPSILPPPTTDFTKLQFTMTNFMKNPAMDNDDNISAKGSALGSAYRGGYGQQ